ncbi:uncharacterized protein LOC107494696 [Arachis duranensis]|uniref:Uncharacterized protein LOC107494696 n=2 Tax=Arachis TaxID=3817 RepID=A0A9C6TRD5_ARADU|nr:uncharacterized protein LOC107494696 [Arachis duranensis]
MVPKSLLLSYSRSLFSKSPIPNLRTQISPIYHYSVALAPPNPGTEAFLFAETPPTNPEGSTALTQKRGHSTTPSPTDSTGQHSTTPPPLRRHHPAAFLGSGRSSVQPSTAQSPTQPSSQVNMESEPPIQEMENKQDGVSNGDGDVLHDIENEGILLDGKGKIRRNWSEFSERNMSYSEPLLVKRTNTTSQIAIIGANLSAIESLDYELVYIKNFSYFVGEDTITLLSV